LRTSVWVVFHNKNLSAVVVLVKSTVSKVNIITYIAFITFLARIVVVLAFRRTARRRKNRTSRDGSTRQSEVPSLGKWLYAESFVSQHQLIIHSLSRTHAFAPSVPLAAGAADGAIRQDRTQSCWFRRALVATLDYSLKTKPWAKCWSAIVVSVNHFMAQPASISSARIRCASSTRRISAVVRATPIPPRPALPPMVRSHWRPPSRAIVTACRFLCGGCFAGDAFRGCTLLLRGQWTTTTTRRRLLLHRRYAMSSFPRRLYR
jgi:hypothetical protein